jgi:transcriptional regulator with XRE-family HTH domain
MDSFGANLRYQRLLRGWSQKELSHAIDLICCEKGEPSGICPKTISRWENDRYQPSLYYQMCLCKIFGMTTEELGCLPASKRP